MSTEYFQPMLFSDMKPIPQPENNYQIRSFDDPTFSLSFALNEDEEPETRALEQLGYFIVSEATIE
jgi:ssRNA-specific RNase YbeY (16S rRNA maturation enzyme)